MVVERIVAIGREKCSFRRNGRGFFPLRNMERGWKIGSKCTDTQRKKDGRMVSTPFSCVKFATAVILRLKSDKVTKEKKPVSKKKA